MADPTYANGLALCVTELRHQDISRPASVTYACDVSGLSTGPDTTATGLQGVFKDAWKAHFDNQVTIGPTTVLIGDGTSSFVVGVSAVAATPGERSMASLPSNCAALIKKVSGFGGRKNRGRNYLPWVTADDEVNEAGVIDPGVVADLSGGAGDWTTALAAATAPMVLANRVYDLPWTDPRRRLTAVEMGPTVSDAFCETVIATQRRRMSR